MQIRSPSGTSSPGTGSTCLAHREALAGERGLLDLERRRDADPPVGGDAVARLHEHDVAGHELRGVDLDGLAVPPDPRDRLHHLGEGLDALLRLRLLTQPDDRVQDGEAREQDGRAHVVRDDGVDDRRGKQDDLHEVLVLPDECAEPGLLLRRRELVRSVVLEPPPRLVGGEAVLDLYLQSLSDRARFEGVPRGMVGRDPVGCSIRPAWLTSLDASVRVIDLAHFLDLDAVVTESIHEPEQLLRSWTAATSTVLPPPVVIDTSSNAVVSKAPNSPGTTIR